MNKILNALKKYGLSENEAHVYKYLLFRPEATAYEIAKNLDIPRATMYKVLDSLVRQQLASKFKKNNVVYFALESTRQLVEHLEDKKRIIESVLPEMQGIIENASMRGPQVRLYTGKEGAKIVWEEILETLEKKKIKEIYSTSRHNLFEVFPRYFSEWIKRREALGVRAKLIYPESDRVKAWQPNELLERKFLPAAYPFTSDILIYGNRTAMFSHGRSKMHSVIIESADLTNMFKVFFLYMWNMLPQE